MPIGFIGRKHGMTRVFTETGKSIPVTVVECLSNRILQIKTMQEDGYRAFQMVAGSKKLTRVNKPMAGHFSKAGVRPGIFIHEFRLDEHENPDMKVGDEIAADLFSVGECVDVRGLTRGKGFAGTVKRHNFAMQDLSHGNSLSHRAPGSIGNNEPGRVMKGKKMAGQLGNVYCTIQNQEVVRVDLDRGMILVKGGLPGAPNGLVIIKRSVKSARNA